MRCPSCGHESLQGAKFCTECGSAQPGRCLACSTVLPTGGKFCPECGSAVTPPAAPADPLVGPTPAARLRPAAESEPPNRSSAEDGRTLLEAERRRMTVLFADLVGSTNLSAVIDPEDYGEVISRYIDAVEDVVREYDGHVANYLGDGLLVYFGYPRAHEEDSCRACFAALDIVAAVRALKVDVAGIDADLAVRIGICSGTAIIETVGGGATRDGVAVGETLNLAARLQSIGSPNSVLISDTTERLVRRFVRTRHLGRRVLRGIPEAVEVYELLGRKVDNRDVDGGGADPTPLVGRDFELELLQARWQESRQGKGRVVMVTGEAGLGKSRLIRAFREGLVSPFTWLLGRATSFYSDTPLRPLVDSLPGLFEDGPERMPSDAAQLTAFLHYVGVRSEQAPSLLARFFGLPVLAAHVEALQLSSQLLRKRTLELLIELLMQCAHRRPMVLVIEDAHWLDETTLEFVDLLSERVHAAPLLLLVSGRPTFDPPLVVDCEIRLRRLPRDQAELLMRNVAAGVLSSDAVEVIAQRADGNPLYLEELTRSVLEPSAVAARPPSNGARRATLADAVPASLQELLMARVDRGSVDRTVIQAASAIGRTCSYAVLRKILPIAEERMSQELEWYVEDGLLCRRGTPPDVTYTFRHTLLRDAVYDSITRRARRHYHRVIAEVLKRGDVAVAPEVLAYHCAEAGETIDAANYWNLAGTSALDAFALTEAINHLRRGLALLEGDDRAVALLAELRLRTTLGVPLMLTQGFASEAVGDNYRQLLERAAQVGESTREVLLPALWGMWTFYEVGAQLPLAQQTGQRLLDVGAQLDDSGTRLAGHIAYGAARLLLGDISEARGHFERGLAIYDRSSHGPLSKLFGQDGGAMCCSFLCWVHAHEGDDERGRRRAAESLRISEELHQPATRGFVEAVVASFHCLIGDHDEAEAHAHRVIELGESQGMPHWAAQGRCNLGWALVGKGEYEAAVACLRQGLDGLRQVGARAATSYFLAALVEAQLGRRDVAGAAATLEELHSFVASSQERFNEAEAWRLHGELCLARNDSGDAGRAEQSFRRAVEVARAQGAEGRARRAAARLSLLAQTP